VTILEKPNVLLKCNRQNVRGLLWSFSINKIIITGVLEVYKLKYKMCSRISQGKKFSKRPLTFLHVGQAQTTQTPTASTNNLKKNVLLSHKLVTVYYFMNTVIKTQIYKS